MGKQTPYEAFLKLDTGTHTAQIRQLLVTPDNKYLITSGVDKTIRIWDISTKTQARMLLGQIGTGPRGGIQRMALSPDGNYLAVIAWMYPATSEDQADRDSEFRMYNLSTGNLQAGFFFRGTLQDVDFSPDGKYIILAGNQKEARRTGRIYVHARKNLIKGFGDMPPAAASGVLHDSSGLIPSLARFIPGQNKKSAGLLVVATTWIYHRSETPEYTGMLEWFTFNPAGTLTLDRKRETEGWLTPESLTVSREHVILTTHHGDNKKFYCHDHSGNLLNVITSETAVAQPVFSKNDKYLVVGQREDTDLVQVKVYTASNGQFHVKSTYYGHDAEVLAVAMLEDGTVVSAGGDQNAIHFWSADHLEGEKVSEISGVGRTVHALGINPDGKIGVGNHDGLTYEDGRIVLQRHFDLQTMTLRPSTLQDEATYQRSRNQYDGKELIWIYEGNVNLWLLPDNEPLTGTRHPSKDGWIWYHPTTFGFTENGSIITGANDGKIRVAPRDPVRGYQTPLRLLGGGYSAPVKDHASSSKWMVTAGADQIISLWYLNDVEAPISVPVDPDKDTLAPALNLFIGSDDEWVIWSKSGYYTASQRGDRRFGYHINRGPEQESLYFPSDRFIKSFFRPDIIQAIVETGSEERALEKIKGEGGVVDPVDVSTILPPIIEFTKKSSKGSQVTLEFTVERLSSDQSVTRVWIVQNDHFAWEAPKGKKGKKFTVPLRLAPGTNRIKILAETQYTKAMPFILNILGPGSKAGQSGVLGDSAGTSRGASEDLPNKSPADSTLLESREPGTLFLLAVGVSEFKDTKSGVNFLKFADDDAGGIFNAFGRGDLASQLEAKGRSESIRTELKNKAFESVEATMLTNQFATKKAILDEVQRICDKIGKRSRSKNPKRDVFMVFLSGHGVRLVGGQMKDLYYWNYDFNHEKIEETGLSFMELGEKITCVPAEVVLVTDACHSGMAGREVVRELDANELAKRIYAINERGLYILNAARSEEKGQEFDKVGDLVIRHGIFARSILDALNEQANPDISMIGLMDFVQRKMRFYMGVNQTPVFRTYGDLLPLTIYNK